VGEELQYRIKSEGEAHERVASEYELHAVELEKSIVVAGSRLSSIECKRSMRFCQTLVNNKVDRVCDQFRTSDAVAGYAATRSMDRLCRCGAAM